MNKISLSITVLCFLGFSQTFASHYSENARQTHNIEKEDECNYNPRFPGTLLAPVTTNQDPGMTCLQPYFFYTLAYGSYNNNWSLGQMKNFSQTTENVFGQIGITKHMQLEFIIETGSTFFQHKTSSHFADLTVGPAFQLFWDKKGSPEPNLRILLLEVFPTGEYEMLDPLFDGNDATGEGSYQTSIAVDVSKILYGIPCHPFYINASIDCVFAAPYSVRGVNHLGGSRSTNGTVGFRFSVLADFSFQYAISRDWSFGCDLQYYYITKANFNGQRGFDEEGNPSELDLSSSNFITATPAIEYSPTFNLAFLLGGTITLTGRNTEAFVRPTLSLLYTF